MIEILRTDQIGISAFPDVSILQSIWLPETEALNIVLDLLVEINVRVIKGFVIKFAFGVRNVFRKPRGRGIDGN